MISLPAKPGRRRRGWTIALVLALVGSLALGWWTTSGRGNARGREAQEAIARAERFLKKGQPDLALRAVARVPETGPWAASLLTVKGLALAAAFRPEEARPLLERSLQLDPKQPIVAKTLAAIHFGANEIDQGFKMLQLAARLDPQDFQPWFAGAEITLRFGYSPERAVKSFQEALRRRPDHEDSQLGLIEALLATEAADEATPLVEAAVRRRANDPRVLCLAARHARALGRIEEMGRYLEQALAVEPDRTEALALQARFLHITGRDEEALSFAERAVANDPDDAGSLNLLTLIQGSLGLREQAAETSARRREIRERAEQIRKLTEEIQRQPNNPELRWKLGRIAADGGQRTLAANSFRAALALDPNCQPALQGLAALGEPVAGADPSRPDPDPRAGALPGPADSQQP